MYEATDCGVFLSCHHEGLSSKNFENALVPAFNNAKNIGLGEGRGGYAVGSSM